MTHDQRVHPDRPTLRPWGLALGALGVAGALMLSACGTTSSAQRGNSTASSSQSGGGSANSGASSTGPSCRADAVKDVVGQKVAPSLLQKAQAQAGAEQARVVRPNSILTRELNPRRLNLEVDAQDVVVRVHCG